MPRPVRRSLFAVLLVLPLLAASALGQQIPEDSVRIIGIFAHPDDGEYKMGGTAARLAEAGHKIKFVSLTNGDAGHHEQGGGARRRKKRPSVSASTPTRCSTTTTRSSCPPSRCGGT